MGSLYLSANPGPWSGVARIFDFGNTFDAYNNAATGEEADGIGLLWDWAMVGKDLWNAVSMHETKLKSSELRAESEVVAR
jgi:hypothetical protein